jgi:cell wall-associated NlpC family hydrolase
MTLLDWANDLVLTNPPFAEKGRSRKGLDCWGLVVLAHREVLNKDIPTYEEEYETTEDHKLLNDIFLENMIKWEQISTENAVPGDVVVINLAGRPLHAGIIVDKNLMLHTERKIGTVIERFDHPKISKRLAGIFRYRATCGSSGKPTS